MTVRRRVGLLIPSSNTMIEQEYWRALPEGVSAHIGRVEMTTLDDAGLRTQDADAAQQARLLGTARVDAVLFCQSIVGFYLGRAHEARLAASIAAAAGCPALTAAAAMVEAVQALGARRLAFVTPFGPDLNASVEHYFAEAGCATVALEGFALRDNFSVAEVPVETLVATAQRADRPEVEAIVIPGGNLPCLGIIEPTEAALGKPVVTTNQAGIHALLRRLAWTGPAPAGLGRLFATLPSHRP